MGREQRVQIDWAGKILRPVTSRRPLPRLPAMLLAGGLASASKKKEGGGAADPKKPAATKPAVSTPSAARSASEMHLRHQLMMEQYKNSMVRYKISSIGL